MDENKTDLIEEKQEDAAAFNSLHKYTDHYSHLSRHLSKIEEERPCDNKDGTSVPRNKDQRRHSIGNNFVHSQCEPSSSSVSTTSSRIVENNGKDQRRLENQIHHHHHHHYHSHYYNYYSNSIQGAQKNLKY